MARVFNPCSGLGRLDAGCCQGGSHGLKTRATMSMADSRQTTSDELADERWFREPTAREHRIAAGLFVGFGVFFVLLYFVQSGWWFRWVVLGLGVISILHGARHLADSWRRKE